MNHDQYLEFKQWLSYTGKLDTCPDAVSSLYSINKFLQYRICDYDLFELIEQDEYALLYEFRHHKQYQASRHYAPLREKVLMLSFEYLGKDFEKYIEYEASQVFRNSTNEIILYLHQGNIACLRFKHPIEDVTAAIAINAPEPLYVHASYCPKCGITFMHKSYFLRLRKQYKIMVANFCELSEDGYTPVSTGEKSAESLLMICGYNVKANGPTALERQALLRNIIVNGILTKEEIFSYLSNFIIFNGEKHGMEMARSKWESDYDYLKALDLDAYPVVSISQIQPYSRREITQQPCQFE